MPEESTFVFGMKAIIPKYELELSFMLHQHV